MDTQLGWIGDLCFSDFVYSSCLQASFSFCVSFFFSFSVVTWYTLVWKVLHPSPISKLLPFNKPQNNLVSPHRVFFTGYKDGSCRSCAQGRHGCVSLQSWGSWLCSDRVIIRSSSKSMLQDCFSNSNDSSSIRVTSQWPVDHISCKPSEPSVHYDHTALKTLGSFYCISLFHYISGLKYKTRATWRRL